MSNLAILVASTTYSNLNRLDCCHDDLVAMKELLEATENYEQIEVIENASADELKDKIRAPIEKKQSLSGIFFYFSGHGFQYETEFFFCASNFDVKRPNETGLSTTELHTLLKIAEADLVVKVIDACNSGTLLIKSDSTFLPQQKHGFNNLIQISSCLDSQNSLTGQPLSVFTEKFRVAALRKREGPVYYTDIIDTLRDEFLENNAQTPRFVFQVTGREQFADSAKKFDTLRARLSPPAINGRAPLPAKLDIESKPPKLLDLLQTTEARIVKPEMMRDFVGGLFDALKKRLSTSEFADFFKFEAVEHADFKEITARGFIIRVLSNEKRPDNFVTATIERKIKRRPGFSAFAAAQLMDLWGDNENIEEIHTLHLNCSMERAQLKVTLTPKYLSLKQLVLVITCAPSLENCFVFELLTQHSLRDFEAFDVEGSEIIQRWYRFLWTESTDAVVEKIAKSLEKAVRDHLESTFKRLQNKRKES